MAAKKINLKTVASVIGLIAAIECGGTLVSRTAAFPPILLLGAMRICEIIAIIPLILSQRPNTALSGYFITGISRGVRWSLGFAVMAMVAFGIVSAMGADFLAMIRQPLPVDLLATAAYFLVGGVLSPVAEELVFRGTLYGYFRRWGVLPAMVVSTALFALAHLPAHHVPIPQILGGMVFAVAYELEKNLMVPITIHISGNLAIFTLSLL